MKKLLALILALCMVMSFAACGSTSSDQPAEQKTETGAPAAEEAPKEEAAAPLEKITIWTNAFANSTEAQEAYCAEFKKDTGVELDWVAFPKEDYEDVILASLMSCDEDELPDIVFNAPMGVLLRQELLYDMTDLINNNEKITALLAKNPTLTEPCSTEDGIFGFCTGSAQSMVMWTRQDLMDELKLTAPTNLEEFTEMLRTIKEAHPELIPLTGPAKLQPWELVSGWFGVKNQITKKEDGKFADDTLTPAYKEYMDYMAMLYKEGLVDKELPTNASMGDVRTRFVSGKAAVTVMWDNMYAYFEKTLKSNGYETEPLWLDPFDGERGCFGIQYTAPQMPYLMTIGVEDSQAQQIFDTFFGWLLASENGMTISMMGPEGFAWENVDGVYTPTPNDIGTKAIGVPPVDPDFKLPVDMGEVENKRYELANEARAEMNKRPGTVMQPAPGAGYIEYNNIVLDLEAKRTELFYLYITGQCDYDAFCTEYQNYCEEQNIQGMLDEMNAQ